MADGADNIRAARQRLAETVQALIAQQAVVLDQQAQSAAGDDTEILAAQAVREFAQGPGLARLLRTYIDGRLEVNLLVLISEILSRMLPPGSAGRKGIPIRTT